MSNQVRWLWPSNDSNMRRHRHYRDVIYEPCRPRHEDILLPGSDDDLDHDQHCRKKRRIESLAKAYLSGKPLFISTATLKGPFGKVPRTTRDKYADYVVGEPLLPDSIPFSKPSVRTSHAALRNNPRRANQRHNPDGNNGQSTKTAQFTLQEPALPDHTHQSAFFEKRLRQTSRTPDADSDDDSLSQSSIPAGSPSRQPQSSTLQYEAHRIDPAPVQLSDRTSSEAEPHIIQNVPGLESQANGTSQEGHGEDSDVQVIQSVLPANVRMSENVKKAASDIPPTPPKLSAVNHGIASITIPAWEVSEPTGFTPINRPSLGHKDEPAIVALPMPKTKGKLPNVRASKQKTKRRYLEAVSNGDNSPLLIRRKTGAEPMSKASTLEVESTELEHENKSTKQKPRKILFDSSINVPFVRPDHSPKSAQKVSSSMIRSTSKSTPSTIPKRNDPPAIDIEFDQDSLAMNFDFIDRHTNSLITGPKDDSRRKSVSEQLRRALRESGASIIASVVDRGDLDKLDYLLSASKAGDPPVNSLVQGSSPPIAAVEGHPTARPQETGNSQSQLEDDEPIENIPYISTQAAMEEAHRALFDNSSPIKANGAKQATPGVHRQQSSHPDVSITPFHKFNEKINAATEPDASAPPPDTQALFDNMSPFLSPEEPKKVIPKPNKRASFAPVSEVEEDHELSPSLSPQITNSLVMTQEEDRHSRSSYVSKSQAHSSASACHSSEMSTGHAAASHAGETSETAQFVAADFSSTRQSSRSSSPDGAEVILSQRGTAPPTNQHDHPTRLSEHTFRLSDILMNKGFRSSGGSFIDEDTLFSVKPSESSIRSSTKPAKAKGRRSASIKRHSLRQSLSMNSLSQPEKSVGKSRRPRISMSQPQLSLLDLTQSNLPDPEENRSPANSMKASLPPPLSGTTTIVEETLSGASQVKATRRSQSSYASKQSLPGGTPLEQTHGAISPPPTSAESRRSIDPPASSFQAAQRVFDVDLDEPLTNSEIPLCPHGMLRLQ